MTCKKGKKVVYVVCALRAHNIHYATDPFAVESRKS
jgi:hypothetical protein